MVVRIQKIGFRKKRPIQNQYAHFTIIINTKQAYHWSIVWFNMN